MAEPDPATAELIRKLQRELNGLTRARRGKGEPTSSAQGHRQQGQRRRGSRSSGSGDDYASESARGSDGDGDEVDRGEDDKRALKKRRKEGSPDGRGGGNRSRQHSPKRSNQGGVPDQPRKRPAASDPHHQRGQHHQQRQAQTEEDPFAPCFSGRIDPAAVPENPTEHAAMVASATVRSKAKQTAMAKGTLPQHLPRQVKVFHSGVRWGVLLPPESIKTRGDLATALNEAFAGEILSCGRGDMLTVVFLDGEGHATEFPSLRVSGGVRESTSKWKAVAGRAVKVYVRRS